MHSRISENHVVTLPREILDRVERVLDYHNATKHSYDSIRAMSPRRS